MPRVPVAVSAIPFPVAKCKPFLVVMPKRVAEVVESRGIIDEFEIWSRRFGRRLSAALYWPLLH